MERFDLVVVGAGRSGLEAARLGAMQGARVAVLERAEPGGRHDHRQRAILALSDAARRAAQVRRAGHEGFDLHDPTFKYSRLRHSLAEIAVRAHPPCEVLEQAQVVLLRGEARFLEPLRLDVGGVVVEGRHVVIACGSRPEPAECPLGPLPVVDPASWLSAARLPHSVVLCGDEPDELVLAQALARLGVRTYLTRPRRADLVPGFSADANRVVEQVLMEAGVRRLTGLEPRSVEAKGDVWQLRLTGPADRGTTISLECAVVPPRLVPDAGALAPERSQLSLGPRGIPVDARLRTSAPSTWCVGSLTGDPCSEALGHHQARLAVRAALDGSRDQLRAELVPAMLPLDPPLGRVGATAQELADRDDSVLYASTRLADTDAVLVRRSSGFVRVAADRRGQLLAAEAMGPEAGMVVGLAALLMDRGLGLDAVAGLDRDASPAAAALGAAAQALHRTREPSLWSRLRLPG